MNSRKRGFQAMVLGLLVAAGLALTPAAFARSHVDIGIAAPGVSLGYSSGYHRHGYYGYYGGYYGPSYYYAPAYYAPAYYGPSYYNYGNCYVCGHYDRWGNKRR